jgi:hypothetical protein
MTCARFRTVDDAFRWVLASEPTILAIGEAHAPKDNHGVASATKRFTDGILPLLKGRASDVLVEAWAPNASCKTDVNTVARAHAPVHEAQADTNPNEYLALGVRAKALGIVPDLLRPSCDDYARLADAGADTVDASLRLIKRLTEEHAVRLVRRNEARKSTDIVVTYGGAMHNDIAPVDALAAYSFGPALTALTNAHYTELDLIVPDYAKRNESWERLPWFATYLADPGPKDHVTVYRFGERSFALIFARTEQAVGEPFDK